MPIWVYPSFFFHFSKKPLAIPQKAWYNTRNNLKYRPPMLDGLNFEYDNKRVEIAFADGSFLQDDRATG